METTEIKPSTLFKKAVYANEDVLRIADKLGVRILRLEGNDRFMVEMPGLVEGTSNCTVAAGYGVYTSLAMIAAAYVAGQKSQK